MQLKNIDSDFKTEYLFRTCSFATILVMSIESNPIRCATMLCHFGQTRNGSVATHFINFSSTETSSATSEYVAIPERFGSNEEPGNRIEERTRNKPNSAPKMCLKRHSETMYICNMQSYISISILLFIFGDPFNLFLLWKTF